MTENKDRSREATEQGSDTFSKSAETIGLEPSSSYNPPSAAFVKPASSESESGTPEKE